MMDSHLVKLRDIQFLMEITKADSYSANSGDEEDAFRKLLIADMKSKISRLSDIPDSLILEAIADVDIEFAAAEIVIEVEESEMVSDIPSSCIVVAAKQELRAVWSLFEERKYSYKERKFGSTPGRVYSVPMSNDTTIRIGVMAAAQQRVPSMRSLLQNLTNMEELRLDSIIMVGMMGGFPDKSKLLEVILPSHIYDGRSFSIENKKFQKEPGAAPSTNATILDIAANLPDLHLNGKAIPLRTHKTTITVNGKWDNLNNKLVKEIRSVDEENSVGVEQEGAAIAELTSELERMNKVLPVAMIKGVADYCSIGSSLSDSEIATVYEEVLGEIGVDDELDPSSSLFKPVLQRIATQRATIVALEIIKYISD